MCRSILKLRLHEGPAPRTEIEASALQYVTKVSGFNVPSRASQPTFEAAVREIADVTEQMLADLHRNSNRRSRQ